MGLARKYLDRHPILRYRMTRAAEEKPVRGLRKGDPSPCPLMLDDMTVLNGKHYACIIHLREHGAPVGAVDFSLPPAEAIRRVREARLAWTLAHPTPLDSICARNCLDVCVDYNTRVARLQRDAWRDPSCHEASRSLPGLPASRI